MVSLQSPTCSGTITTCPSATIIKSLLHTLHSSKSSKYIPNIRSFLDQQNTTITHILDAFHHLQFDHKFDSNDDAFNDSLPFFTDSSSPPQCTINDCPFIDRHYRDRGLQRSLQRQRSLKKRRSKASDEVLMDTMAMIHCYFVHSVNLHRLSKADRISVDALCTDSISDNGKRTKLITDILTAKHQKLKNRNQQRYRKFDDNQNEEFSINEKVGKSKDENDEITKSKESDEKQEESPDIYEIGQRFYIWNSQRKHPHFLEAKYKNLKEEILNNPLFVGMMNMESWDTLSAQIRALVATKMALQITSNGLMAHVYGIQKGKEFDEEHLKSLKLYTDFTDLCAALTEILRRGDPSEIQSVVHWTRTLIETVQCFGSPLNEKDPRTTYFRGVSKNFIFKHIVSKFNLPLSTTTDV